MLLLPQSALITKSLHLRQTFKNALIKFHLECSTLFKSSSFDILSSVENFILCPLFSVSGYRILHLLLYRFALSYPLGFFEHISSSATVTGFCICSYTDLHFHLYSILCLKFRRSYLDLHLVGSSANHVLFCIWFHLT